MKIKLIGIIALVLICVFCLLFFAVQSVKNGAISLEEQIRSAASDIQVQEKRRADLLPNLVETIKAYDKHEYETLMDVVTSRNTSNDEKSDTIRTELHILAEAYPDLKSNGNYQSLLNELATTENLIANHRKNYNNQIKSYNRYCRRFPNQQILNWLGYEVIDSAYLSYNVSSDAPTNLFGE